MGRCAAQRPSWLSRSAARPRCQCQQPGPGKPQPQQQQQPQQQPRKQDPYSAAQQQQLEASWWRQQAQRPLAAALAVLAAAPLLLGTPLDVAQARSVLTQEEKSTIKLFQRSRPSVVYITSLTTRWVLPSRHLPHASPVQLAAEHQCHLSHGAACWLRKQKRQVVDLEAERVHNHPDLDVSSPPPPTPPRCVNLPMRRVLRPVPAGGMLSPSI